MAHTKTVAPLVFGWMRHWGETALLALGHHDLVVELLVFQYAECGMLSKLLGVIGGAAAVENDPWAIDHHLEFAHAAAETTVNASLNRFRQLFPLRRDPLRRGLELAWRHQPQPECGMRKLRHYLILP